MQVFPIPGFSQFADTWGAARDAGRKHEGTDIFAAFGSPVVAVDSGTATQGDDRLGGQVVSLHISDGSHYYYAHLSDWEGDFPRKVKPGDVLGYVGTTGNAAGMSPHLHFGWYTREGDAMNPFDALSEVKGATATVAPATRKAGVSLGVVLLFGALAWVVWNESARSSRRNVRSGHALR